MNWCFWTMVLEKILDSPLDCKEINPKYLLEGLMLKLKLQHFGHLLRRTDSFEKTLNLGKIEGRRRRGWQMRWLDGIADWTWVWVNSGSWRWTGRPGVLQSMGSQRVGHDLATDLNMSYIATITVQNSQIRCILKKKGKAFPWVSNSFNCERRRTRSPRPGGKKRWEGKKNIFLRYRRKKQPY